MTQTRLWLFSPIMVALTCSCGSTKPNPVLPSSAPDLVCQEGTDPAAPPPTAFSSGCPKFAEATPESCESQGWLFSEDQKMCVKPEECVPPFQPDGKLCKGSGGGGNPGCHQPTPYRRCTGSNICYCSSNP